MSRVHTMVRASKSISVCRIILGRQSKYSQEIVTEKQNLWANLQVHLKVHWVIQLQSRQAWTRRDFILNPTTSHNRSQLQGASFTSPEASNHFPVICATVKLPNHLRKYEILVGSDSFEFDVNLVPKRRAGPQSDALPNSQRARSPEILLIAA